MYIIDCTRFQWLPQLYMLLGKHVLSRLKDIEHCLVSGDVTITKIVRWDWGLSRKACGGHGFLVCSGLVELSNTYLQSCTVEGDNQMLPHLDNILLQGYSWFRMFSKFSAYIIICIHLAILLSLFKCMRKMFEGKGTKQEIFISALDPELGFAKLPHTLIVL